ncbi:hypothetical protein Q5P01_024775 [Channa striata]|uniref:Uncharacterized protein n=1 Tax=Channa striata TaxID=64152 RepID=A0AA88IUB9_CHASR|nr:hypothetical protein Q5P01_024775 [Channa striata]
MKGEVIILTPVCQSYDGESMMCWCSLLDTANKCSKRENQVLHRANTQAGAAISESALVYGGRKFPQEEPQHKPPVHGRDGEAARTEESSATSCFITPLLFTKMKQLCSHLCSGREDFWSGSLFRMSCIVFGEAQAHRRRSHECKRSTQSCEGASGWWEFGHRWPLTSPCLSDQEH